MVSFFQEHLLKVVWRITSAVHFDGHRSCFKDYQTRMVLETIQETQFCQREWIAFPLDATQVRSPVRPCRIPYLTFLIFRKILNKSGSISPFPQVVMTIIQQWQKLAIIEEKETNSSPLESTKECTY